MQNAIRSACRAGKEKNKRENEGEEELPGAEEAVRRWRCCGGVARRQRLQVAVLLLQTVDGEVTALPFSSVCLPLLSFWVVSLYPPGLLSSFLSRFKLFLPLRLSLSVVPFYSVRSSFPLLSVLSLSSLGLFFFRPLSPCSSVYL